MPLRRAVVSLQCGPDKEKMEAKDHKIEQDVALVQAVVPVAEL